MRRKSIFLSLFLVIGVFFTAFGGIATVSAELSPIKMWDYQGSAMARITTGDINWDNAGKTQSYACEFKVGAGIYGLSDAFTAVGYGEAKVELRQMNQIPWANDVAVPSGNLGDFKSIYVIYYIDKPEAVSKIEFSFAITAKGDATIAKNQNITYAMYTADAVPGWNISKVDMSDRTAVEGGTCVNNTLLDGDLDKEITNFGNWVYFSGTGTSESEKVNFILDDMYISTGTGDMSLPEEPMVPEINGKSLQTKYDVYGETVDLSVITASTRKPDTTVNVSYDVTGPDGIITPENNKFKLSKPGNYSVEVMAVNNDTEALSTTETFTIVVLDPANPPTPNADILYWDFDRKTFGSAPGTGSETNTYNVKTEFSTNGANDFGVDGINNGAAKVSTAGAIGSSGSGWAVYDGSIPDANQFASGDYGAIKLKLYVSNPEDVFQISVSFTVANSGVGRGNKGLIKDIPTGFYAFDDATGGWKGEGWFEYIFDINSMTPMGGYTFSENPVFTMWDFIVGFKENAPFGSYVILDDLTFLGERYAPTVTLDPAKIQPLLYGETGKTVDLSGLYEVSHAYDLEISSTRYSVVFNGSQAINVEDNKITPYKAGKYTVSVISTDIKGGSTIKSFNISVTGEDIDVVEPVISIANFSAIQTVKEIDLSKIVATDDVDPNPVITFTVVDPTQKELTVTADKKFTATYNGKYKITAVAKDSSGNEASRVIDLTINCSELTDPPKEGTSDKQPGCKNAAVSVLGVMGILAAAILFKKKTK